LDTNPANPFSFSIYLPGSEIDFEVGKVKWVWKWGNKNEWRLLLILLFHFLNEWMNEKMKIVADLKLLLQWLCGSFEPSVGWVCFLVSAVLILLGSCSFLFGVVPACLCGSRESFLSFFDAAPCNAMRWGCWLHFLKMKALHSLHHFLKMEDEGLDLMCLFHKSKMGIYYFFDFFFLLMLVKNIWRWWGCWEKKMKMMKIVGYVEGKVVHCRCPIFNLILQIGFNPFFMFPLN
jgi:hypothetical protein